MQIEVKGRNTKVPEDLEERLARRFEVIAKQVSELAVLEVDIREHQGANDGEEFTAITDLRLKGTTLRAEGHGHDAKQAVKQAAAELEVQVKRHREKRRARRPAREAAAKLKAEVEVEPLG